METEVTTDASTSTRRPSTARQTLSYCSGVGLEELVREGARRMLAAAPEAEVDAYLAAHAAERDARGGGW